MINVSDYAFSKLLFSANFSLRVMTSSSLMKHVVFTICCVSSITLVHSSTFLVKWYFYDSWCCAVSFMQSLCIMVMIYTLHYSFLARGKHLHCIRCRVHVAAQMRRRKNAYRTKNSVLLQRHLAELKRKAGDNEQIPCSIYSFLNGTCNPSEDKLPEGKSSSSSLSFEAYFLSSILAAV